MPDTARVEQSRTIPVTPEQAFRGIIEMDVPTMFRRRYGPIPAIRAVSGRDGDNWSGTVGQTRVLELAGGGSIRETVVDVDEPHAGRYSITDFKGPLKTLLTKIDGEFLFTPPGPAPESRGATTCFRDPDSPRRRCPPSAGAGEVIRDRCSRNWPTGSPADLP